MLQSALQEYVCYRIRLVKYESETYYYRSAAFALSHAGLLYSVSYNISTFAKAMFMKLVLNEYSRRPFRSSAFTSAVSRLYNPKTNLARYNYFTLTYYHVKNEFLPPPYKTQCVDYGLLGFVDAEDCIKQCLTNSSLASFDRFPYSVLEERSLNYKLFNVDILKRNATVTKLLYRSERKCQSKCKHLDCSLRYTITQVAKDPNNDVMTFNVLIPQLPTYVIKFRPKMQFLEYFIYVLSCFGTWFGLSVLSLNPFKQSIWMSEQVDQQPRRDVAFDVWRKQKESYTRCCLYCSQTGIIVMSETKHRLQLLLQLTASLAGKRLP